MKHKKIIAFISVISIFFFGFSLTGEVSDFRRTVEGYLESAHRVVRRLFETRNYSNYSGLCDIPETENGYVPQGYCFSSEKNLHFVSYYHDEKPSVISVIDAESGQRIKTLPLKLANGKDFTGHAGGIAEDGKYFYLVDGKKIYRVELNAMLSLADGEVLVLNERIYTDVKCSYLNSDGIYLYAGEFYTYTDKGTYDTDKSHHKALSLFETTYSRCNAYLISEISDDFAADADEVTVPSMVFTTPNCVQGFARLPDGVFVLSTSFGRDNDSFLKFYEDVTKKDGDFTVDYNGVSVLGYHLKNSTKLKTLRQPPLLEGIDDMNGKVSGIFESCADKYSDSAFVIEKICVFE